MAKDAAAAAAAASKTTPSAGLRTIEEQVQLVRVFRVLAFEIPLELVERKLEVSPSWQLLLLLPSACLKPIVYMH